MLMYSPASITTTRMSDAAPSNFFPAGDERLIVPVHQFAEALGHVVDLKDKYTHAHSVEVAEVSYLLAYHLGLDDNHCDAVHVSAAT